MGGKGPDIIHLSQQNDASHSQAAFGARGRVAVKLIQYGFLSGCLVAVQLTASKSLVVVVEASGTGTLCLVLAQLIVAVSCLPGAGPPSLAPRLPPADCFSRRGRRAGPHFVQVVTGWHSLQGKGGSRQCQFCFSEAPRARYY